ncbi:MAG: hypothetical protein K9G49_15815 [Taibaiella sp.]|nr:hypothetical protein [Taibaiella sp.]
MAIITVEAYHTQSYTSPPLNFPKLAEGYENWLGNGFYFWHDFGFGKWWGDSKKCGRDNKTRQYIIYKGTLMFDEDDFIDTVFNQEDYDNFTATIEKFAKACQKNLGKKPTLIEFNQFIEDFNIWEGIKVIRFQDLPENNVHLEVLGFYYKKRIQYRVNAPGVIIKFVVQNTFACL